MRLKHLLATFGGCPALDPIVASPAVAEASFRTSAVLEPRFRFGAVLNAARFRWLRAGCRGVNAVT